MGDEFCEGADAPGETAAPSAPASHAYEVEAAAAARRGTAITHETERPVRRARKRPRRPLACTARSRISPRGKLGTTTVGISRRGHKRTHKFLSADSEREKTLDLSSAQGTLIPSGHGIWYGALLYSDRWRYGKANLLPVELVSKDKTL